MCFQNTIDGVIVFVVKAEVVGQFTSYDGFLYVWLDRFLVFTAILADSQNASLNRDLTYKEKTLTCCWLKLKWPFWLPLKQLNWCKLPWQKEGTLLKVYQNWDIMSQLLLIKKGFCTITAKFQSLCNNKNLIVPTHYQIWSKVKGCWGHFCLDYSCRNRNTWVAHDRRTPACSVQLYILERPSPPL